MKRLFSCTKQDAVATVPEVVAGGLQPGTDAKHTPPDIKSPVMVDQPSSRVVHLAAGPQAPEAAHLAAAKQASAVQPGKDAPSDLLKAHRGGRSDSSEEPSQTAQGGSKPNKRNRRAVRRAAERAAKAAAAALEGEADDAPAMPTMHEQGDEAVKGEAVKAATPPSIALDEPGAPPTPTSQAAAARGAVHADAVAPIVDHKQNVHPTRLHGTGMLMICCIL